MIDLEEVLAVADYYDKRKQTMIELGALKDPAYLATLADGEAVKAFEALRPLVERIRELELAVQYMFREFVNEPADCEFVSPNCPHNIGKYWCGADDDEEKVNCYIRQAVKSAKEAGDETSNR